MKRFCISLRKHAADVINFEKKKMIPLIEKELKWDQDATHNVTFVVKNSHKILLKIKITETLEIIDILQSKYRGAARSICNLRFNVPDEIPVIFCNGSNYDYNFIMKELPNECKGKFECPRENTEKFKTFTVPIEKVIKKIDRDDNEGITTVFYKIKFIDSARFMTSSLSNLVDNLAK